MTGAGDLDRVEDDAEDIAPGEDGDDETKLDLNENDRDPSAGGSDIGGRAGSDDDDDDTRGEDGHEAGGGHTGMGKGPTGS